jgi:nitrate/TMAO reductase-like tetraheme cytochrome c subunit
VAYLGNNGITLTGAALTTASGITLVLFWLNELTSAHPPHPYAGIILFLTLPAVFVLGLVLMPIGVIRRRLQLKRQGLLTRPYPKVDFHEPLLRRAAALVGVATVANVALLGTASFKGVEYLDSNQFCGLTCHTVMQPEYTAFVNSPHARVGCAQCHIGPGAPWFVKSKLSGVRQVFAVAFHTYSRPIPSPVEELRPARETCEQCHWPQKVHGDKFLVRTSYGDDEKNTPSTTVLVLKIGGRTWQGAVGIHGRHLDAVERISYVSTGGRREVIPRVSYIDDQGQTVEFVSEAVKVTPAELAAAEHRKMDCVDCHNRPTHAFELPERAVDRAIDEGRISRDLPFVRKKAVELLKVDYPDRATAGREIPAGLAEFYRTGYPKIYERRPALVESASAAVAAIYMRNVFPEMKVTWGIHPNHIGHESSPGCFRCHDGEHKAADGQTITQDCDACHTILAMQETNPKILAELGLQQ